MSEKAGKIGLLLVDDQSLFLESVVYVIAGSAPDMEVLGTAANGIEAVSAAERLRPDLVLMDLRMPEMDGVDATRLIRARFPEMKIIMLTTFMEDEYVRSALKRGANGYLLKNMRTAELLDAIRAAWRGSSLLAQPVAALLARDADDAEENEETLFKSLSNRERQVASLALRSYGNKQIADKLCLTERTVRNYVSSIYFKLDVRDRFEFIRKAAKMPGLIMPE
jgi:DNA-binding NarL/FixJ family response regulator